MEIATPGGIRCIPKRGCGVFTLATREKKGNLND